MAAVVPAIDPASNLGSGGKALGHREKQLYVYQPVTFSITPQDIKKILSELIKFNLKIDTTVKIKVYR